MTPTKARDRAAKLSRTDTDAALAIARSIGDSWFACQALAWVGRFASDDRFNPIIRESLIEGQESSDPYRVVAAAAWPVRALVERNNVCRAASELRGLIDRSRTIENPASRSEALFLLFQAIFPAGSERWRFALRSLMAASIPVVHWRQGRNLLDAVMMVAGEDHAMATQIIQQTGDAKLIRKFESRLEQAKRHDPRPFFW